MCIIMCLMFSLNISRSSTYQSIVGPSILLRTDRNIKKRSNSEQPNLKHATVKSLIPILICNPES